ncbi:hypothetical protein FKM82_009324 [Ascaphus truei]
MIALVSSHWGMWTKEKLIWVVSITEWQNDTLGTRALWIRHVPRLERCARDVREQQCSLPGGYVVSFCLYTLDLKISPLPWQHSRNVYFFHLSKKTKIHYVKGATQM